MKKKAEPFPKPNWSLLIVGVGPHRTGSQHDADVITRKIIRRLQEVGHEIRHASLILDGEYSENLKGEIRRPQVVAEAAR